MAGVSFSCTDSLGCIRLNDKPYDKGVKVYGTDLLSLFSSSDFLDMRRITVPLLHLICSYIIKLYG